MKAYNKSSTPAAKSQEDIRKILAKHKADGVQFIDEWSTMTIIVRFLYTLEGLQHTVSFRVAVPRAKPKTATGLERSAGAIEKEQKQLERSTWRAIYWAIKSRMEAVEFGIETFTEAFLSHFEIPGTDQQIGDVIIPRLTDGSLKQLK